jgi:hypothetical protein
MAAVENLRMTGCGRGTVPCAPVFPGRYKMLVEAVAYQ